MSKEKENITKELLKAAGPLLRYLNDNYHPNVTCIITPTSVELTEKIYGIPRIWKYIND